MGTGEHTEEDSRLSAGERQRLLECALEPIRTPGAAQAHGVIVVVDRSSFDIIQVSENSAVLLGAEAVTLLDRPLAELVGAHDVARLSEVLDGQSSASNPVAITVSGRDFDVIVHATDDTVIVDFEPVDAEADNHSAAAMYEAIMRLSRASTLATLWAETARELRALTGFDRVMIYHFHPDSHGEVVAEERAAEMEPYLGLHYPASDIPAQARDLYLTKLSRVIATSEDTASTLVSNSSTVLDLSTSELRAVSPHHLQFMRNMGQASTMSLSLVHDGELIGMITCAHRTPRRLPFVLRQGLEILATQVALQISSMRAIEQLTRQVQVRSIRSRLLGQLSERDDIGTALLRGEVTVLDLVPADGAILHLDGVSTALGTTPTPEVAGVVVEWLASETAGLGAQTDALALDYPDIAPLMPGVAGLLLLPLGGEGSYLAWFRREISQSVDWLGNMTAANRLSPLSPRSSFSSWTESVDGRALPWDGLELEASELCRDLDGVLLRRAESRLAALALHDPLTALPNRRLLMDRLEHALTKYARGEELALLFVDLDGFKAINDTWGHEAGDELIVHAAMQIVAATRTQDTVARLGGDEFVIMCEDTTIEEADIVAARLVEVIGRPFISAGRELSVTASVGVTAANLNFSATELIRAADSAMYRAKALGRNRAAR
jgi:chemotaxis family two-component system sensor kinase Cph1